MSLFTFEAIGTHWEVETPEPMSRRLQRRILERIDEFDATYSRFRPDSLVARLAAAPEGGRFAFPDDSVALFDLYDRLRTATEGAVDPLVGRNLELLGYDRTYSLTPAPCAPPRSPGRLGRRAAPRARCPDGHPGPGCGGDVGRRRRGRDRRRAGDGALLHTGEHLSGAFDFAYVRMFADGRAEVSQNFDGELFS